MTIKIKIAVVFFFSFTLLKAQSWGTLGLGLDNFPDVLKEYNGKLYVGGAFAKSGGDSTLCIASFDGMQWHSVGIGMCGEVYNIQMYQNEIYAEGQFPWAGNCLTGPPNEREIVRWNGSNWYAVGTGVQNVFSLEVIRASAIYSGELYIGGSFSKVGGVNTEGIAKWDGSTWSDILCPPGFNLYSMAVYKGELYIGGDVSLNCITGNTNGYEIARWNGAQWDSVGGAANGLVTAMVVDTVNNYLYIGGAITNVAGVPCWGVARWDGVNWTSPGSGTRMVNGASSMCFFNNELYVGCYATQGLTTDTVLARFDGTNWHHVIGPNNTVTALGTYNGNLYVGGYFDTVGTIPVNHIVCYGNNCPQGVGVNEIQNETHIAFYPNPFSSSTTLHTNENLRNATLIVYNTFGQEVRSLVISHSPFVIERSDLPSGLYFIRLTQDNKTIATDKLVITDN